MGIMSILDEECIIPQGSDQTFIDKLTNMCSRQQYYERAGPMSFTMQHYAGKVTYNVDMFLEKNKDTLFNDIQQLFETGSRNPFLPLLFPKVQLESKKRPPTAGSQFKTQVGGLIETLMSCHPHYIRCIRPNARKAPQLVEADLTMNQVKYLGLVENVRVRRAGFSYRQTYEKFFQRFRVITKRCWPKYDADPRSGCKIILDEIKIPSSAYEFGKTKIFIRNPQIVRVFPFFLPTSPSISLPSSFFLLPCYFRSSGSFPFPFIYPFFPLLQHNCCFPRFSIYYLA